MTRLRTSFALVLLLAPVAHAGSLLDVRLPASLCVEGFNHGPTAGQPSGAVVGECEPGALFDDYDTRSDGLSEPELVLHPKFAGTHWGFDAALALGAWADDDKSGSLVSAASLFQRVPDDSSFARVTYRPSGWSANHGLSLALFPYSSDRLHLGFSHALAWGTGAMFGRESPVPAVRLGVRANAFDLFLAAKGATSLDRATNTTRPTGGVLAGGGVDLPFALRVDANGGWLDQGTNPKQDVLGQPVETFGASVQLSWTRGEGIARASDVTFVTDDPTSPGLALAPRRTRSGTAAFVAASATWVGQQLEDPNHPGTTTIQPARSADLRARVETGAWRVDVTAMVRELSSVLEDVPGFVPYQALGNAATTPETFVALRADRHFDRFRLTPGAAFTLEMPATFNSKLPPDVLGAIPTPGPPTTVVAESPGSLDFLPSCGATSDCHVRPILGAEAFVREDFIPGTLVAYLELHDTLDPNLTALERSSLDASYARVRFDTNDVGGRIVLVAAF